MLLTKIKKELLNYRQDRYRFYENNLDFIKVVEVQFLQLTENRISFTIHVGIYVPTVNKILWGLESKSKSIGSGECMFFCNIHDIINSFKGKPHIKYWRLENLESLNNEISDLVKAQLIPFVATITSLLEVNNMINRIEFPGKYVATYPIMRIVLKYVLGKTDEIDVVLQRLIKEDVRFYKPLIMDMNEKVNSSGYKPVPVSFD